MDFASVVRQAAAPPPWGRGRAANGERRLPGGRGGGGGGGRRLDGLVRALLDDCTGFEAKHAIQCNIESVSSVSGSREDYLLSRNGFFFFRPLSSTNMVLFQQNNYITVHLISIETTIISML